MEANSHQEPLESTGLLATSVPAEDSVKSRILERIKAQMAKDSYEIEGPSGTTIYLKAPDWPI